MDKKDFQKFRDEIKKKIEEQNFYIVESLKEQKERLASIKRDLREHSDKEISKKLSRIDEMYDIFARVKENIDSKVREIRAAVNREDIKLGKVEQQLLSEINKFKEIETKKTADVNQKFIDISKSLNKISYSLEDIKKENTLLRKKIKKDVSKELSRLDKFAEKQAQFMAMLEKLRTSQTALQNIEDLKITQAKGQIERLAQAQMQLKDLTTKQKEMIGDIKDAFEKQLENLKEYFEKNIQAKAGRLSYEFLAKFSEFAKLREEFSSNLKDVKKSLEKNIYEKKEIFAKDITLLSKNLVGMAKELDDLSNSLSNLKTKISKLEEKGRGGIELRTVLLDQANEKINSLSKDLDRIKTELASTVKEPGSKIRKKIKILSQRTTNLSRKIGTINESLKKVEELKKAYLKSDLKRFDTRFKRLLAQNKRLSAKLDKFATLEEINNRFKSVNENAIKITNLRKSLISLKKIKKSDFTKEMLAIKRSSLSQIKAIKNEISRIERQIPKKQPDINKKIKEINLAILSAKKEINKLKEKKLPKIEPSEIKELKTRILRINKKIESLPRKQRITPKTSLKLRNLLTSLNNLQSEILRIKESAISVSDFKKVVSSFKEKMNKISGEISKVSASTENLKKISSKIQNLEGKYLAQNREINNKIKKLQESFSPIVQKYKFKQVANMRDKLSELTDHVNMLSSEFKGQIDSLKSDFKKEEMLVDKKLKKIESSIKQKKLKRK